jgi:hypothetical protein
MAKPKLFGISDSRAIRAIWGIEETGIDDEHVPVSCGAVSKADDYLAVNPNGRVPALIDGDLQLLAPPPQARQHRVCPPPCRPRVRPLPTPAVE